MNNFDNNDFGIILKEHKVLKNISTLATEETFNLKSLKKKLKIIIVHRDADSIEFDIIGIQPFLANALRRLMLSDVPSMAIEKVHIYNNTSIIQDEVLAHRLGLIPLKADPRLFQFKSEDSEATELDTLEFELKIKCQYNKEATKDSSRAEDMFVNNNVYSKHIKWLPIGNQEELYKKSDILPIHNNILIAKMRPGHELDLKLVAVKGIGRDHAKFSPVATAFYRLLPEIKLLKEIEGEAADRLQSCFSPGVISISHKKDGRRVASVNNPRYDTGSRNVYRYDDLKDAVVISKKTDHFIFSVESVGALPPDAIFIEAIKILKKKCEDVLEELKDC